MTLKTRLAAAGYLLKRVVLKGETQRFAPSGAPALDASAPPEDGALDGVFGAVARGWARRRDNPGHAVRVDLYLGGDFLGRAFCDLPRTDLAALPGFSSRGRHGFEFALPEQARRLGGVLRVVAAGSGLELAGSPVELRPEASAATPQDIRAVLDAGWYANAAPGRVTSLAAIQAAYGRRLAVLAEPDPAAFDAAWPVTRAMMHFNVRKYGGALDFHGSQAYSALLLAAGEHFAGTTAGLPMDRAQVDALTRPTGWVLEGRVRSHMLLDVFARQQQAAPPADEDAAADLLSRFAVEALAHARLPVELLGETALRFLAERAGEAPQSRLERAMARLPDFAALPAGAPLAAAAVRLAAEDLGLQALLPGGAAAAVQASSPPPRPGVRILAGDHGDSGLSVNARHSLAALQRLGRDGDVAVAPLTAAKDWRSYAHLADPAFETVLLHVPPDDAVEAILRLPPGQAQARLVGFFMWETERLPAAHQLGVRLVDEIWTATRYCEAVFRTAAPTTPVHVVGHAVQLAEPEAGFDARALAGAAPGDVLFLFHFDAHSWISRKNPEGLIRAFRQAFPAGDERVRLLIKVRRAEDADMPQWKGWWAAFYEAAAQDARVVVVPQDMSGAQMAALTGAADAFVSLHRSEGFGYGPAEAMLAGKPLVTSGYSGVLDFATEDTALLVPVQRRALRPGEFLYGDVDQVWGEPDLGAAARAMRRLYDDRAFAAELGERGRRHVEALCSMQALADRYGEALSAAPATRPTDQRTP